jgi:4-amino-4-deoxy-L-arabinose transferase-like glycosyltransferase
LRLTSILQPRRDAPLPAGMIFSVIFVVLYASHITLLSLPYYWDEAGYYIPAAWDFFRTGSLIPITTLSNAHPPLPSVYLALWWKASGFSPDVTREAVLIVATFALLGVWRLAMRLTGRASIAFWTVFLTALYPVWFAQSTLAQADIFAAAFTLWGLVYALPEKERRPWVAAVWLSLAALSKETAIAIPLALSAMSVWKAVRGKTEERVPLLKEATWLLVPVLPLAGWYAWHYAKTGFVFGNAGFLRYNAEATLNAKRILAALFYRTLHLTAHMNMFVPVAMALAAQLLPVRGDARGVKRKAIGQEARARILVLLALNAALFSVLGGALLTRYLLPMYPLVLVLVVSVFYRRVPYWPGVAVFSALAFVLGLFINPPYRFAPEDNLEYARVVRLHMAGIAQLEKKFPESSVLTAWPVSDELAKPELGYVKTPFKVVTVEDFTEAQVERAAQEPETYSTALVFSTKYDPRRLPYLLGHFGESFAEKYFDLHHDLPPRVIAARLGGRLEWYSEKKGMWIGLIRFDRQIEADARPLRTDDLRQR